MVFHFKEYIVCGLDSVTVNCYRPQLTQFTLHLILRPDLWLIWMWFTLDEPHTSVWLSNHSYRSLDKQPAVEGWNILKLRFTKKRKEKVKDQCNRTSFITFKPCILLSFLKFGPYRTYNETTPPTDFSGKSDAVCYIVVEANVVLSCLPH